MLKIARRTELIDRLRRYEQSAMPRQPRLAKELRVDASHDFASPRRH